MIHSNSFKSVVALAMILSIVCAFVFIPKSNVSSLSGSYAYATPARVQGTNGMGLKLRSGPGLQVSQIGNNPEGTAVKILEGPTTQDGFSWYRIDSTAGTGWSAGTWLVLTSTLPTTPTANTPGSGSGSDHPSPGANQIILFHDANYQGNYTILEVGEYSNPAALNMQNDTASSILLGSNAFAILYWNDQFDGYNVQFNQNDADFSRSVSSFNDQTSSVRVILKSKPAVLPTSAPAPTVACANQISVDGVPYFVKVSTCAGGTSISFINESGRIDGTIDFFKVSSLDIGSLMSPYVNFDYSVLGELKDASYIPKCLQVVAGGAVCIAALIPSPLQAGSVILCSKWVLGNPLSIEKAAASCIQDFAGKSGTPFDILTEDIRDVLRVLGGNGIKKEPLASSNVDAFMETYLNCQNLTPGNPSCLTYGQVAIFADSNFSTTNSWRILTEGDYPNPAAMGIANDSISLIAVSSGVMIEVFEHDNFEGISDVFYFSFANLQNATKIKNDSISSLRVRKITQSAPGENNANEPTPTTATVTSATQTESERRALIIQSYKNKFYCPPDETQTSGWLANPYWHNLADLEREHQIWIDAHRIQNFNYDQSKTAFTELFESLLGWFPDELSINWNLRQIEIGALNINSIRQRIIDGMPKTTPTPTTAPIPITNASESDRRTLIVQSYQNVYGYCPSEEQIQSWLDNRYWTTLIELEREHRIWLANNPTPAAQTESERRALIIQSYKNKFYCPPDETQTSGWLANPYWHNLADLEREHQLWIDAHRIQNFNYDQSKSAFTDLFESLLGWFPDELSINWNLRQIEIGAQNINSIRDHIVAGVSKPASASFTTGEVRFSSGNSINTGHVYNFLGSTYPNVTGTIIYLVNQSGKDIIANVTSGHILNCTDVNALVDQERNNSDWNIIVLMYGSDGTVTRRDYVK